MRIGELKKVKNYKEILKISLELPNNKDSYLLRSNAYLHLREWNKLIECCNNGLLLDENESEFYNLKGKGLGKLGNQEEKAEQLKIAIQLNENIAAYHRNLGAAYYNMKKYPEAIVEHGKAIELEPNNAINYHNKGAAHFRIEQLEESKKCFEQACEKDKKLALSYSWLGDTEKKLGNINEASALYKKAYEISGNVLFLREKEKLQKEEKSDKPVNSKRKRFFGLF